MADLAALADLIEAQLEDACRAAGTYADDPENWHRRHRNEMWLLAQRIETQHDGRLRDQWNGARVRIAGVTASSTSGLAGALRNWVSAARKKALSDA